jgi:hypothetical protein
MTDRRALRASPRYPWPELTNRNVPGLAGTSAKNTTL